MQFKNPQLGSIATCYCIPAHLEIGTLDVVGTGPVKWVLEGANWVVASCWATVWVCRAEWSGTAGLSRR